MTKWTLGSSYPIALTISLVPALSPLTVQAAPLNAPPATGILNSLCYDYVPKIEKPSAASWLVSSWPQSTRITSSSFMERLVLAKMALRG